MTGLVELAGVTAGYGGRPVLRDLDVAVEAGEFVAVLGPNGSGKTTLIKVLLGLLEPTAGTVAVDGLAPRHARHLIGYVPQHRGFDADLPLRGRDLVELGLTGGRPGLPIRRAGVRRQVDEVLALVGAEAFASAPVGLLSGGEQQRLRIAQALLGDPRLLLLDEPASGLDERELEEFAALIASLRQVMGVLLVEHNMDFVMPLVDRLVVLNFGKVIATGTPNEVRQNPEVLAAYLGVDE